MADTRGVQLAKIHYNQRFRGILLFEIILIFVIYLLIFGATSYLLNRQTRASDHIQSRLRLLTDVQNLHRVMLERSTLERTYLLTQAPQDLELLTSRNQEYDELARKLQRNLINTKVDEASQLNQETYFVGKVNEINRDFSRHLDFLVGKQSDAALQALGKQATELQLLELQSQSMSHLTGWRALIESDIARLTTQLSSYRHWSNLLFALLGLVVITSLAVIAYTYVSPAFEKLLRKVVRQNEQLRELDSLKNEFLSIASHQLRTPLSELKWTLTLLARESKGIEAKQRTLLVRAGESTDTMIRLVTSLLNLTRMEQGRLEYKPEKTNVVPIIRTVMRELAGVAKEKEVALKTSFSSPNCAFTTDPLLFKQIIQNLVDNAIHYNRPHGSVTVSLKPSAPYWLVEVRDTGLGIPPQDKAHLFAKFYRARNAVKARPDGSGLGLYFVKKIMQRHGGKITFQSTVNEGTTFSLFFPKK